MTTWYETVEEAKLAFSEGEPLSVGDLCGLLCIDTAMAMDVVVDLISSKDIERFHDPEDGHRVKRGYYIKRDGYKGWGYCEFLAKIGLDPEPDECVFDAPIRRIIMQRLSEEFYIRPTEADQALIKEMRDFLTAVVKESYGIDYHAPMLAGILAIECDEEFIKAFAQNLGFMWN